METLGFLATLWLFNMAMDYIVPPKPICYVEEVIDDKRTYAPRFCEDLEGKPE